MQTNAEWAEVVNDVMKSRSMVELELKIIIAEKLREFAEKCPPEARIRDVTIDFVETTQIGNLHKSYLLAGVSIHLQLENIEHG